MYIGCGIVGIPLIYALSPWTRIHSNLRRLWNAYIPILCGLCIYRIYCWTIAVLCCFDLEFIGIDHPGILNRNELANWFTVQLEEHTFPNIKLIWLCLRWWSSTGNLYIYIWTLDEYRIRWPFHFIFSVSSLYRLLIFLWFQIQEGKCCRVMCFVCLTNMFVRV